MSDDVHELLTLLAKTRRMARDTETLADQLGMDRKLCQWTYGVEGEFYGVRWGVGAYFDSHSLLHDYNTPPKTQPGLWCQWEPTSRTTIEWDQGEKFYNYIEWIKYITNLLKDDDYTVNGRVRFSNEYECGTIVIRDNVITIEPYDNVPDSESDSDASLVTVSTLSDSELEPEPEPEPEPEVDYGRMPFLSCNNCDLSEVSYNKFISKDSNITRIMNFVNSGERCCQCHLSDDREV